MGPGGFLPTNPDLADMLGDTDFDFEISYFLDFFGSRISGLGPALAHPLGHSLGPPTWAQLAPTHLGPPTWAQLGPTHLGPDAAGAGAAGRILKSRSRPLPTHPGMKYFRKETLAVDCGNDRTTWLFTSK